MRMSKLNPDWQYWKWIISAQKNSYNVNFRKQPSDRLKLFDDMMMLWRCVNVIAVHLQTALTPETKITKQKQKKKKKRWKYLKD